MKEDRFFRYYCLFLSLPLVLNLVSGCTAGRKTGWQSPLPLATTTKTTMELLNRADSLWEERGDKVKLEQAIKVYEEALATDPTNKRVLTRLSRACYLLSNGYLTEPADQIATFDKGAKYGEQALILNEEFKKLIDKGAKDYKSLHVLKSTDIEALYWVYSNLGKWASLMGFGKVWKYKNKLKAYIDRVNELDETYFYGAGPRELGAFYAKTPSFAGGDLNKAKEYFEKSLEIEPNYFGTKVLMAEYYATKTHDRALFQKLLDEVINADPSVLPEIIPEQLVEQNNAKKLLERMDDLF